MSIDFDSYLLATSPPGFDSQYWLTERFKLLDSGAGNKKKNGFSEEPERKAIYQKLIAAKLAWERDEWFPESNDGYTDSNEKCSQVINKSSSKKKHVSFADDIGLSLTNVMVIRESSSTPPILRRNTPPATLLDTELKSDCSLLKLKLNFSQPAADYLAFRHKLEMNCVSLENVITKELRFYGTIKVKNIAFDKLVKLHCTFDNWLHSSDIAASYSHASDSSQQFDVFSFSVTVPNDAKRTLFAICFDVPSQGLKFWDNNSGNNYEILTYSSSSSDDLTDGGVSPVFSLDPLVRPTQWTEFAVWTSANPSVPYW